MRCTFTKANNQQCKAFSMSNSDFCYLHNPKIDKEYKKANQSKGGKANALIVHTPLPALQIRTPQEVILLLEDTINRVRAGEIEARVANSIGVLSGQLIKAIEISNIETRVEVIERAIFERRTTHF